MALNDLEWLSKIFNDTERRAASPRAQFLVLGTIVRHIGITGTGCFWKVFVGVNLRVVKYRNYGMVQGR